jgi:mono/diheme cytochrome c family protein
MRPTRGWTALEHFQEKACPALDAGWNPVFRPKMRQRKGARAVFLSGLCETALALFICGLASVVLTRADEISFAQVQRGKYLADVGDCLACHTVEKGTPFAGGRGIETPFGTIYSSNLTPDRETGLGAWSDEDFYNAMHFGVAPDGTRLYPAFPYPYFTKLTRDDVAAIRAYLNTLSPVKARRPPNELTWPLDHRIVVQGWNWIYFTPGEIAPNPQKSAEWNRGAYLVEGPGHCGACHTPKNVLGADKTDQPLQGGQLQNWFIPKLDNDPRRGLGSWSVDDIVEYLKTGRNAHSGAAALMAEVVANSTSKLNDEDLHAAAVYVKDIVAKPDEAAPAPEKAFMEAGRGIFSDSCSGCHQANGEGVERMFPPLAHNANVQSADSTTVIRVIVEGAQTVPTNARPTPFAMPAYNWKLSDDEIAAVATFVRNAWGNAAPAVTADEVRSLRGKLHPKLQ